MEPVGMESWMLEAATIKQNPLHKHLIAKLSSALHSAAL